MGVEETKTLEITHLKVHFSRSILKYCMKYACSKPRKS